MRALLLLVVLACTLFACERTHPEGGTPHARGGGPRPPDEPMVIERPAAAPSTSATSDAHPRR